LSKCKKIFLVTIIALIIAALVFANWVIYKLVSFVLGALLTKVAIFAVYYFSAK